MQPRNDDIKALKAILTRAKIFFCEQGLEITNENVEIYDDALSAFSMIGKEKIYELAPDVYQFINCCDFGLRETAVTTLGLSSRLHLPEFKETAYRIWLEDTNNIVKTAALCCWASYYANTKDPSVLGTLYSILIDENRPIEHRRSAMQDIFYVSGEMPNFYDPFQDKHFYMLNTQEEFNQKVDWDEIKAIMKKYVPGVLRQ